MGKKWGGLTLEELRPYQVKALEADALASVRRVQRWAMLSAVREVLQKERVAKCCTRPSVRPGEKLSGGVDIVRSAELRDARYSNLAVCGDVWRCPVCAPYIAAQRGAQLRRMGKAHLEGGGGALLVTLTFRHQKGDDLPVILEQFAQARQDLYRQRAFRALLASVGYVGDVRTLEVTHGEHGWHPHTHDLFMISAPMPGQGAETEKVVEMGGELVTLRVRNPSPVAVFGQAFYKMWKKVAKKHGLDVLKTGFHVRATLETAEEDDFDKLTGYMQDRHEINFGEGWDAAREMTGAATKIARKGGSTPMQLLADYALDGDAQAGKLFRIYADAFKGRRQLSWSSSLKDLYGDLQEETTDQEAAEKITADFAVWASIPWPTWKRVLRAGGRVRGQLLDLAAQDDRAGVFDLLEQCTRGEVIHSVTFRGLVLKGRQ
jgi:hypothetical protein